MFFLLFVRSESLPVHSMTSLYVDRDQARDSRLAMASDCQQAAAWPAFAPFGSFSALSANDS